jgi:hypothetical protein
MRSVYSHGCVLTSPKIVLDRGIEDIASVFSVLKQIDVHPKTEIELVNSVAVEEVQNTIGKIHFGHGYHGKTIIAVWRSRALEKPLAGEFASNASSGACRRCTNPRSSSQKSFTKPCN